MNLKVIAAVCTLALGLTVSPLRAADNDMKSDMGMAPKMDKPGTGMTPKMDTSSTEMKDSKLYTIQCGSPCDFQVTSHDKQEVIQIALEHVKTHHGMTNATAKDAEAMVKVVEPKM